MGEGGCGARRGPLMGGCGWWKPSAETSERERAQRGAVWEGICVVEATEAAVATLTFGRHIPRGRLCNGPINCYEQPD